MRSLIHVVVFVFALPFAGCASHDPKAAHEPVRLTLTVKAASTVNPDDQQRAAPIVVRVYELKNEDAFTSSDFFSLQDKDKTVLGDDLVARDQFQLRPGNNRTIQRNADPATTTLGVIAAYRDLPNSVWRATWTLTPAPPAAWYRRAPKLQLTITIDTNAIRITDAQQPNP
ncbi:type VI secretion system lipoprotein TssJ [Paraburkholderia rhizosphaerae]|uniref:Type VI secretion system protein VasD n=1 Tax=Paraburkholderia rhizosphaerae TaxID=480658 RepID=A0A4R8LDD2_9BURK|nr:type VI secretion system lipoprotein TssJ [Paraburkholderia rhizosphaerae]TDY40268.1 type VI secretion system protein VasD [Paraburkholderia rhizosphaerae]